MKPPHLKSAVCVATALVLAIPTAVWAHAKLVRSDPAAGAQLTSPPSKIVLTFTEAPELSFSSVKIIGAAGDTVALDDLDRDPNDSHILIAGVPRELEGGSYTILWRVAASDGHPTSGTIDFAVVSLPSDSQAVAPPPTPVAPVPQQPDAGTIAVGGAVASTAARWVSFIAIFVVIGVVTFRLYVIERVSPGPDDVFAHIASTNAATLGIFGSVGGILAAALKLVRQSAELPDTPLYALLFGSRWGTSLLLQAAAFFVALAAFAAVHKAAHAGRSRSWNIAAIAGALLVLSPSLGGHAAAAGRGWLAIPADVIHVGVGAMWVGTLAAIVIAGISAAFKTPDDERPGARLAAMVNVFSPLALACGGAVVATGVASSILRLPNVRSLWSSPYGIVLLLKLLFVGMLFAAGAWNWRRMKPRLTGEDSISPMKSTASLELVLALAVLAITAILIALELP